LAVRLRAVEREAQRPGHFGDVGERLREERKRQGVSQRELAARLGLSPSLISQIETGRSKPSVSTLYAIVTELHLSLDRLFGGPEEEIGPEETGPEASPGAPSPPRGPVVRPEERHVIELESDVRWERLTGDPEDDVDFMYVVYEVGGASAVNSSLMRHPGREYGYVISGRLGLQIGFRKHTLGPGDSIAFNSTQPHRLWTIGDEPVHAIWCVVGREE
jgi:transcriptional regulator with XRE-family HTH domain